MGIYRQQLKHLLKRLVEIKSITGNELEAAIFLKQYFKAFGVEGEIDVFAQNRGNFIASHITNPDKETLVLCSHIDVVPEGDRNFWDSDPFVFTEKDSLWYGRGTCDAKGSVAAMAIAFLNIINQNNFDGNVVFLAVAGEERGSVGAKRFLEVSDTLDGCVIIGEPTNADVNISQKGRIEFTIDIIGVSGHASRPEKAKNAIMSAAEFLLQLKPYITQINCIQDAYAGKASLAATLINTIGTSANTIPSLCRIIFDRRWIYTENVNNIIKDFTVYIEEICDHLGIETNVKHRIGIPAVYTNSDSKIVKCALQACEEVKNEKQKLSGFPACCDMHVFINSGIDTIVLGPGKLSENHVHGYNEFIRPEDLEDIIEIYIKTVKNYFTYTDCTT